MRAFLLLTLLFIAIAMVSGAPSTSKLQIGNPDLDNQQFIEEVVVESVLQVRNPSGRQARTNTRTNLQDGARVSETKIKS